MIRKSNSRALMGSISVLITLAANGSAAAETVVCSESRMPLEMAGNTLCLLSSAMPYIGRDKDGQVHYLTWSHPERLPSGAKLPPGVFHLTLELGQIATPTMDMTNPSEIPEMREAKAEHIASKRLFPTTKRFYPLHAHLNGQSFSVECRDSINPEHAQKGGQDCQIDAPFMKGVRINVHFGTVIWVQEQAWPRLDESWNQTWPPYLDDLGASITKLTIHD